MLPLPNVAWHQGRYTEALERIGVECPHLPYETRVGRYLREHGRELDVVVLSRYGVADRFASAVRTWAPRAKIVFNTVDLHHLREEREARHRGSRLVALKAIDTKRRELRAVDASDVTLVLSTVEAQVLAGERPGARVRVVPLLRDVPGRSAPLAGRRDVLFIGGFRHRPNVDAVELLVGSIWPALRRLQPGVRLHIVGSATPAKIAAMASDDIVVHGHVPDIAPLFRSVRVSVAPLRFGAGLKGKVADSLGHGVPCVATSVGVEGSGLRHGEHLLVADDPRDFARAVADLCTDDALWERLSLAGLAFVRERYSMSAHARRMEELFDELDVPLRPPVTGARG